MLQDDPLWSVTYIVWSNPNDRVPGSELLNLATFEQMKYFKEEARHVCEIYPRNHLIALPNVDRTTILTGAIFTFSQVMKSWHNLHQLLPLFA